MSAEALRAVLCGLAFIVLVVAGEYLRRRKKWPPEVTRKFLHVGGCVGAMFFPLLFSTPWPVLALAVFFCAGLATAQRVVGLRSLNDVDRESAGAMLHPLAIGFCFFVAHYLGCPVDFEIDMAVLALSDTAAALVGRRYGQLRYQLGEDSFRSVEGSTIFFLVTFLIVHLILLLATDAGRLDCVLVALLIALLATTFEAISLGGADNLVVPLAAQIILIKNSPPETGAMLEQFVFMAIALVVAFLLARPFHRIAVSGFLAFALAAYLAAGLVDPLWGLTLLVEIFILAHTQLVPLPAPGKKLRVGAVYALLLPAMPLIFLVNLVDKYSSFDLRYPCLPLFGLLLAIPLIRARRRNALRESI